METIPKIDLNNEPGEKVSEELQEFPNLNILHLEINFKKINYNLASLLSLSYDRLELIGPEKLEEALEKSSAFRFSIAALLESTKDKLNEIKIEFDKWAGENNKAIMLLAVSQRKEIKTQENVPNNWFGSITKEEMHKTFLSSEHLSSNYVKRLRLVRKYQRAIDLLDKLYSIIESRAMAIQSILKRRQNRHNI